MRPEHAIAAIIPYLTGHINRFGDYILNLDRKPRQPDCGCTLKRSSTAGEEKMADFVENRNPTPRRLGRARLRRTAIGEPL